MTQYRCINDIFGYCTDKPDAKPIGTTEASEEAKQALYYKPLSCTNSPESCMKYRKWSEMIDLSKLPESYKLKPKTKKAQKLESKITQ